MVWGTTWLRFAPITWVPNATRTTGVVNARVPEIMCLIMSRDAAEFDEPSKIRFAVGEIMKTSNV